MQGNRCNEKHARRNDPIVRVNTCNEWQKKKKVKASIKLQIHRSGESKKKKKKNTFIDVEG